MQCIGMCFVAPVTIKTTTTFVCFCVIVTLTLFTYSAVTKSDYFLQSQDHKHFKGFPLVQAFSCSPLNGRENDALPTSCWMQQIRDTYFVVLHLPFSGFLWAGLLNISLYLFPAPLCFCFCVKKAKQKTGSMLFMTSVGILGLHSGFTLIGTLGRWGKGGGGNLSVLPSICPFWYVRTK